jgi:hypothetical protein
MSSLKIKLLSYLSYSIAAFGIAVAVYFTMTAFDPIEAEMKKGAVRYSVAVVQEVVPGGSRKNRLWNRDVTFSFSVNGMQFKGEQRFFVFLAPSVGDKRLVAFRADQPALNRLHGKAPDGAVPVAGWDSEPVR